MTAQVAEQLTYGGESLRLCSEPLSPLLKFGRPDLKFVATSSACWRGYVGQWAVEDGRLYLKSIKGNLQTADGNSAAEVNLGTIFPGYPEGVFAHWFSGELRCTEGELLEYVHGGYGSVFERDRYLMLERGVLQGERVVTNPTPTDNLFTSDEPGQDAP